VLAAVELYEPGKQSAARTKAFATGVSFQLAELVATSLPPGVGGSQAAGMIRLAFNEQFCPRLSQMPISHPVWISEIYPDHVIAAHDTGPGYALTYFALPFTNEADGITFHPDRQVEVQQVWQAVETSHEYSEEALTHVRQERGPGAALAVLLADRREAAVLRALTAHERG
jgi:hypothetical protein